MDKREFLRILGVGVGVAMVNPMKAAAQRGRILRGDPTDFPLSGRSPEFRRFVGSVHVGEARAHGADGASFGFWTGGSAADGAWIGAAVGAGIGTIVGLVVGIKKGVEQHRRYQSAYESCLTERGYSI